MSDEIHLARTLPSGLVIDFQERPGYRAYHLIDDAAGSRTRVPNVTSICGAVLPKGGLTYWAEARGIEGALEAVRRGDVAPDTPNEEAVKAVRRLRLGADAAKDIAAERGVNVHAILEEFMRTGSVPNPSDHPDTHRVYIRGLAKWLLWANPEPVAVELLVAHPERGYAGRADLIANIGGKLTLVDLKTSPSAAIYDSAHLQVSLLEKAEFEYGEHFVKKLLLVAVDAQGGFREMECVASPELADRALDFYAEAKDLSAKCSQANRIQREILRAA